MRIKAVISYDGSQYLGFQKQSHTKQTVATEIESALRSLGINFPITGSGRTDTGVHATGQVIHFDVPDFWQDLHKLKIALNRKLQFISFKHITLADTHFHARFSAKKRIYRYVFKTKTPSVFEKAYISYYPPFDSELLIKALKHFEGKHDFEFFRKTGTQTHTTLRHIVKTRYAKRGEYHFIYFEANSYLRSQVRMMVDAAMQCARSEMTLKALQDQIDTLKRHTTSLAPPQGLYLARVLY